LLSGALGGAFRWAFSGALNRTIGSGFHGAIGSGCNGLFHGAFSGPLPFRLFRRLTALHFLATTRLIGPLEPRSLLFVGDAHGSAQAALGHGLRVKAPLPHRF
jgi:hypothetical protein